MGGDYTRRLYTFSAKEETICTEEGGGGGGFLLGFLKGGGEGGGRGGGGGGGGGDYLWGRTTVYTYICRLYKFSTKEGTMHRGDYL